MLDSPTILLEDNHLLAIDKPAGMPTAPPASANTAADWACAFLKLRHAKPGNVYLGVVHRLDRPTSGVLLFARTGKAASRIADSWRLGKALKTYLAVVTGEPPNDGAELIDDLVTEGAVTGVRRTRLAHRGDPDPKRAALTYRVLARHHGLSLLEVRPTTGRTHQIRVQLAVRGWPIAGDDRYGEGHEAPWQQYSIGLHALSLELPHPTRPEQVVITARVPQAWHKHAGMLVERGELL